MLISLQINRFSLTCHLVQVYASINRRNFTTKIVNKKRLLKLYTRAEDTNIFSWLSSRLILSCLNSKELKMKSLELSLLDGEKGIPVTPNIMTLKWQKNNNLNNNSILYFVTSVLLTWKCLKERIWLSIESLSKFGNFVWRL